MDKKGKKKKKGVEKRSKKEGMKKIKKENNEEYTF